MKNQTVMTTRHGANTALPIEQTECSSARDISSKVFTLVGHES